MLSQVQKLSISMVNSPSSRETVVQRDTGNTTPVLPASAAKEVAEPAELSKSKQVGKNDASGREYVTFRSDAGEHPLSSVVLLPRKGSQRPRLRLRKTSC